MHADVTVRTSGFGLLALLLLAAGCAFTPRERPLPVQVSFRTTPAALAVQRVAVLPLYTGEGLGRAAEAFTPEFAQALRELGKHEVELVPKALRDELLPHIEPSATAITSTDLLRLRDRLHVDAVVIGRIEQFTSFDPISVGLAVHLVSCLDGEVAWSATGQFDGGRKEIQADVKWWHQRLNGTTTAGIAGWKQTLQSPQMFSRYVSDRLVSTFIPPPPK